MSARLIGERTEEFSLPDELIYKTLLTRADLTKPDFGMRSLASEALNVLQLHDASQDAEAYRDALRKCIAEDRRHLDSLYRHPEGSAWTDDFLRPNTDGNEEVDKDAASVVVYNTDAKKLAERLATNPELVEAEASRMLEELGLIYDDLRGKDVLEVGAAQAVIALIAKKKGIKITSLDKDPSSTGGTPLTSQHTPYVQADARSLPFAENSFDLVFARGVPPVASHAKEEAEAVLAEDMRVLREGGELRFGPIGFVGTTPAGSAPESWGEVLFTNEEKSQLSFEEMIERLPERTVQFLKAQGLDAETHKAGAVSYFIIKKPKKEKTG